MAFFSTFPCKCFIFLISLGLFLAHSYFILQYYFKYEKFEETSSELEWPLELPEVTVCTNDVVSEAVTGEKSVMVKEHEMDYIRVLSFAKKRYFSTDFNPNLDLIFNCEFTDFKVPCKECETLSVADGKDSDTPITGIRMEGREGIIYKPNRFARQPNFVMLVHKAGDPPIFLRKNLIFGDYRGDYVVHLKKKIINRVNCFEEEDLINKQVPGIQIGAKYSYESCLTSCYQNLTFSRCGCILPQFYFEENTNRDRVCWMCRGDFTLDFSEMCDCKPLCRDVEWAWSVEDAEFKNSIESRVSAHRPSYITKTTDLDQHKGYGANAENKYDFKPSLIEKEVEEEEQGYYYLGEKPEKKNLSPFKFRLKVDYETAEVTVVNEKLLMERASLVGTIGGSFCLIFGTNAFQALQLIVLELLSFYSETKRKLSLLTRTKLCFNVLRAWVVVKQLLWLLTTVALVCLSGVLSKELIDNYQNYSTLQHSSIDWNGDFPAVTVCSGVPVSWNEHNNQSEFIRQLVTDMTIVYEDLKKAWPISFEHPFILEVSDYYEILHRKLQIGSRKEREENGLKMEDYIKKCTWSYNGLSHNCSDEQFVQFNNHKYGNCATFNHGSLVIEDNSGPIDDVEMMLSFDQLEVPVGRNGLPGLMVHLHERGTAPLFTPSTTHLVRAFTSNHVTFTSSKHVASAHSCSKGEDAAMRDKNIYQDEGRQHLHTLKSCLESCVQTLTHEEIRCRSCYQPLMLGKYEVDKENDCTTFCPWMEKELLLDKCDCRRRCDSMEYQTQISGSNFNKTAKNQFEIETRKGPIDYTISAFEEDLAAFSHMRYVYRTIFPDGNCGLKVSAQKNVQKVFSEAPKTKLANVLGLVGGILGSLQALLSIVRSLRILIARSLQER